jgi:TolA-binding protein
VARYLEAPEAEEEKSVDLRNILDGKAERKYATRDELSLRLTERGEPPVHSARFTGSIPVQTARPDAPATPTDETLSCAVGDEIIVTYIDEKHIGGVSPRLLQATIQVSGEIDNRPRATQDVVPDAVLRARKNLVEAAAYLELARIFKSMGLMKGAKTKSAEGIERVESVILTTSPIPSELKEQAFKAKWELHLAADDFSGAMAACTLFNKLFPDSPLVDEALMSITAIHMDNKDYDQAMAVLRQVLALPKSQAKAAAQFRIAEATEAIPALGPERAIQEYKLCAERYPDSEFAGPSLAKLIDYHIQHRDFDQAGELLSQIFQDHPDASFLDAMLLKWVLVAYQSGDYAKARDKCAQLLSEYPTSAYVSKAKDILPKIEAKLKDAQAPANGGSGQ